MSGQWQELIVESDASPSPSGRPESDRFVEMGELSSGRQTLEGVELAVGNARTPRVDEEICQANPIPDAPPHVPVFNLDFLRFSAET